MNYKIMADLHTHTVASLHAYSTVKENVMEARRKGLKYLAVTDHYYHTGTKIEKKNERARIVYLNNYVYGDGVKVIPGLEANVNQSLQDKVKVVPWRPVGVHSWFIDREKATPKNIFNGFVESYMRGDCTAFAHIEREIWAINHGKYLNDPLHKDLKKLLESIVVFAKENNIFLELNESSLRTNEKGGVERIKYWLDIARNLGCKIYLGTDAHYCNRVGDFTEAVKILNAVEYPEDLILNCDEGRLNKLFGHLK